MLDLNLSTAENSKLPLQQASWLMVRATQLKSLLAMLLTLILVTTTSTLTRGAHPFHVSVAEAKWNPDTGRLEVSIKCHPIDLENALRLKTKEKIDLDHTENIDELLAEYVRNHFRIEEVPPGQKPVADDANSNISPTPVDAKPSDKTTNPNPAKPLFAKFHWVGKEVELKWAWLYFELELSPQKSELYLTDTLLMDVLEDQSNSVVIHSGPKRQSMMFNAKRRTLRFPRPEDFSVSNTDNP